MVIIDGVKEQRALKPKSVISSLLSDLDIDHNDHDIKLAFRIGPFKKDIARPRSIKIEFQTPNTKAEIFKNIEKLRTLDQWKGVYLSDALSATEQNQQKDLRCLYAAAKSRGIDVKLRGLLLTIDRIRYTYADINHLPHNLSMENVKLIKVSDGYAFQSHHAFFSNMFPCQIKYEGNTYMSSEHLYTAQMAIHNDRPDLLEDIIAASDGYEAKKFTRRIKIKDTWDDKKIKIMKLIIALKFDQNPNLRDRLLSLQGFLYEATKGDLFSCGMVLSQVNNISKDKIPGQNVLGDILCEYRDNFKG